jgi:hypothetical protein
MRINMQNVKLHKAIILAMAVALGAASLTTDASARSAGAAGQGGSAAAGHSGSAAAGHSGGLGSGHAVGGVGAGHIGGATSRHIGDGSFARRMGNGLSFE